MLIAATGLAALGTIADVVPLVGENHVLASFGLRALAASQHPGIVALRASAGLEKKDIDAQHVGYVLGPRLNAAGRLGHAREAVELLTTAGPEAAMAIAVELDKQNRRRQEVEKEILEQALTQVAATFVPERDAAIVVAGQGWHTGVIGIVASRIVEKYYRPTIMIGIHDGAAQGSGRSISGFHLYEALAACREHLRTFGGHAMAAGLRLPEAAVGPFREAFLAYAARTLSRDQLVPHLTLDAEADPADFDIQSVGLLDRLGPFGAGNARPTFAARCVKTGNNVRRMGRAGEHLAMTVMMGAGRGRKAVAWNQGALADAVSRAGSCGIAYTCHISDYSYPPQVELHVRDLWVGKYGDEAAAKEFA
jgi:single-stranded-DNA-specific exonuclease